MKIQTKIALLFTLLCLFITSALSVAVYYVANEKAFQDFYTRLELRAIIAGKARFPAGSSDATAYEAVRTQHLQQLPEEAEFIFPSDSLDLIAAGVAYRGIPAPLVDAIRTAKRASLRINGRFYQAIRFDAPGREQVIVISAVHGYARGFLDTLRRILITANAISALAIFGLGLLFSKRILAPIRRITKAVRTIHATSLHNRLPVKAGKDEVSELGITFNHMIGRLELAFETQRNFVSNASHELNTPLTAIIGEAELALSRTRTPAEYRESIQVVLQQSARLRDIIRSLLELANAAYQSKISMEPVPLPELLRDIENIVSGLYPGCTIRTDLSLLRAPLGSYALSGHQHLLELCLSNILLNACKYSEGEEVVLALGATHTHLLLIVKDHGIGIPEKDMPYIFDPFFRASNAPSSKGYGIGLPLAQSIVHLHGGTVEVSSREQEGTEVVVRLPWRINYR